MNSGVREERDRVEKDDLEARFFTWPKVSEAAISRVSQMMRDGDLSYHLSTFEALEADLCALFGVRHALCCNNGTSAGYSAFRALEIGRGDTVIAPAIAHWATVLPAIQCGARIAFADVIPNTCHIDPDSVCRLIDTTTRAVVVTHMFGLAMRLDELREVCDAHGLALIEDVSHAHGATFQGQPVGSFGKVAFCSFQAAKLIPAGEGGALLTNSEELFYRAMELGHPRRLQSAPSAWQKLGGVGLGFKFRPSALLMALAHESLKALEEQNRIRRRAFEELIALVDSQYLIEHAPPDAGRVQYRYELYLRPGLKVSGNEVVERLLKERVRAQHFVGYLPNLPSFCGHVVRTGSWPAAQDVMRRIFLLDPFTDYSRPLIERYGRTINKTLSHLEG